MALHITYVYKLQQIGKDSLKPFTDRELVDVKPVFQPFWNGLAMYESFFFSLDYLFDLVDKKNLAKSKIYLDTVFIFPD